MELIQPLKPGDKVRYVPHLAHALNPNAAGEYPWVMAWKRNPSNKPEILEGSEIGKIRAFINRSPNPKETRKRLTLVRPNATWAAVVRKVNEDGTIALDIESNQGGVVLHYNNVKIAKPGEPHSHHTCFPVESEGTPVELATLSPEEAEAQKESQAEEGEY